MDIIKDKQQLRAKVEPIANIDEAELIRVMGMMEEAYTERSGCQLVHAKQVGYPYDLALIKTGRETRAFVTGLEMLERNGSYTSSEGSYSLIGRYHVKRSKTITLNYTELSVVDGKLKKDNHFSAKIENQNFARVLQHCYDMNFGRLICDVGKLHTIKDKAKQGKFEEW